LHKTLKEESSFISKLKVHKTPGSARKRNLEVSRSVVSLRADLLNEGHIPRDKSREIKGSFYESTGDKPHANLS
jgi:hypothetical protein